MIFLLGLEEMRFWSLSDHCVLVYNFHTDRRTATSYYETWGKKMRFKISKTLPLFQLVFLCHIVRFTGCIKLWITHVDLWPSFHFISNPPPDVRVFTSVTLYVDCRKQKNVKIFWKCYTFLLTIMQIKPVARKIFQPRHFFKRCARIEFYR